MPFGKWRLARGRGHCRGEPDSTLPGGCAPDLAGAEGSSIVDEPGECAREPKARTGMFLREKLIFSVFFLRGPRRSGERARFMGRFSGICIGVCGDTA